MATIHQAKIGTLNNVAGGATAVFQWNNYPQDTVLSYFAIPDPPAASGPHGTSQGSVEITKVIVTYIRDNYNGDKRNVKLEIKNHSNNTIDIDVWQSRIS
jgi:hypothetical protein